MNKFLPAVLALLVLAAPAARADQPLDHGAFGPSCAPWDGAAVRFGINAEGAAYPQIGISFYKPASRLETGNYSLPLASHDGNVNYCTAQGKCQLGKSGSVEIIEFTAWTSARIKYNMTLDDGTELKGEAVLTGSDEKQFCG